MRNPVLLVGLAALMLLASPAPSLAGETAVHKVAIHVDENDPQRMNLALNNAENITRYYQAKGETVQIEVVAYGPGLHMFREDTSPVKDRIAALDLELDNIAFAACGNTKRKMSKAAGKDIPIISEATMVPSGVVRLMELQEQGWSYVRP
jgi:intracellular sulfur oxidation DsrE/DsrF family protein